MTCHSREGGNPERCKNEQVVFCLHISKQTKWNSIHNIGITSDLLKRTYKHKNKMLEGFSKKYGVDVLMYYETYEDALTAITREKRLKKWRREWKLRLIEEKNPTWKDLYDEIKP